MKTENKLRFLSLIFSSYSFLVTFLIVYGNLWRSNPISPIELSILFSAGFAILIGIVADIISMFK